MFFSAILAPALYLLFGSYVLTARLLGRSWPWDFQAYRAMELLAPWNLVPVFLVACLVAVVRLDLLGTVTWQRGAVFVVLLSICCLILEQIRENAGQESDARLRPRFDPQVKRQRALALVISGVILYPFANILPVMTMTVIGDKAALTVWGGVLELFHVGLWPAAVIVFWPVCVFPSSSSPPSAGCSGWTENPLCGANAASCSAWSKRSELGRWSISFCFLCLWPSANSVLWPV